MCCYVILAVTDLTLELTATWCIRSMGWVPLLSYRRPKLSAHEFSKSYRLCRNYQNSRKCTRCDFLSTWQNLNHVTSECKTVAIRQVFVRILYGLSFNKVLLHIEEFESITRIMNGHTVSHRFLTAEARIQSQVSFCEICDGQSGSVVGLVLVLLFPPPILIPLNASHPPHPFTRAYTVDHCRSKSHGTLSYE
jgi:hypothetical protein